MHECFNLSAWAVRHPTAGALLHPDAGGGGHVLLPASSAGPKTRPSPSRSRSSPPTWPGATAAEMQDQVADPIEKKLQELPYFDRVADLFASPASRRCRSNFKDTRRRRRCRSSSTSCARSSIDIAAELPAGVDRAERQRRVRRRRFASSTCSPRTAPTTRQLKQRGRGAPPAAAAGAETSPRSISSAPRTRRSSSSSATPSSRPSALTPQAIFDSLAQQNAVAPAGIVETDAQRVPLRVTGALDGEKAVADTPVEAGGARLPPGRHRDGDARFRGPAGLRGAAATASRRIGVGVVMAKGGNIITLGEDARRARWRTIEADTARRGRGGAGRRPAAKSCEHAVGEFVRSFAEALVIVLLVSFLSLGWRTGIVVALSVPLVLAIVFVVMNAMASTCTASRSAR